jgi:hypothetical protein
MCVIDELTYIKKGLFSFKETKVIDSGVRFPNILFTLREIFIL